jgi:hypothetical protein
MVDQREISGEPVVTCYKIFSLKGIEIGRTGAEGDR